MDSTLVNKKKLLIVAILLVIGAVGWFVILSLQFRVVSVTPNLKKSIARSTDVVEIRFNKLLASNIDYDKTLIDSDDVVVSVRVKGKSLIVDLRNLEDRKYSFSIKTIKAANGQTIPELSYSFSAKYIPFNKLSNAEKNLQLNQTDVDAIEDPLETFLPHSELGYYLTGTHVGSSDDLQFVLRARITLSRADINTGRDEAVAAQKEQIRKFIESKGLDPNNYPITYDVVDPPF